ncbi:MAG: HEAT repeat domain-containing protein [Candidatus Brocadiia bacterium]
MKRAVFFASLLVCALVITGGGLGGEMIGPTPGGSPMFSMLPSFSATPTPPDVNERSWERWWLGNRAPLLVEFTPLGPRQNPAVVVPQPAPTKSSYINISPTNSPPGTFKPVTVPEKINVMQLLALLAYGGAFKEITREMAVVELAGRGETGLEEIIGIAKADKPVGAISGIAPQTIRNCAIIALGEIRAPKCYDVLVELFTKGDTDVAFFAALALGRLGDPRAADVLVNARGEGNTYLRPSIALAIGMLGAAENMSYLQNVALKGSSNEERLFASLGLGIIGSRDPRQYLLEYAKKGKNPVARAYAVYAFVAGCDPKSSDAQTGLSFVNDPEPNVCVMALMGLAMIEYKDDLDAIEKIAIDPTRPAMVAKAAMLVMAMSNLKPAHEKLIAMKANVKADLVPAVNTAIELMTKKTREAILTTWNLIKDADLRELAPFILAKYYKEDALPMFDSAIKTSLTVNSVNLCLAYGSLYKGGRAAALERLEKSDRMEVRAAVLMAYAISAAEGTAVAVKRIQVGEDEVGVAALAMTMRMLAPGTIMRFFRDNPAGGNPRVAIGMASALGALKVEGAEDALDLYLNSPSPDVRCYAALAMGRIGTKRAAELILQRYPSESHPYALGNLIIAAGFLLKKFPNDEKLFEMLRAETTNRGYAEARAAAGIAWGLAQNSSSFDNIGSLAVGDSDPYVKGAAALALGLSDSEAAIHGLRRGLDVKGYTAIRMYSCYALGLLKDRVAIPNLIDRLKDSDNDVRAAAAIALGAIREKDPASERIRPAAESDGSMDVRRLSSISLMLLSDPLGFERYLGAFKGRGDDPLREMGYAELTEISNLYVPIGFRIDDYLQDKPVAKK